MSFLEILLFIGTLIIMTVGLAGVILPVLPGIPLIFAGALLYGIVTHFKEISVNLVIIFGSLAVISLIADYAANYFCVKKMGGGKAGAIGAVIGMLIGISAGLTGIIIGSFLGAVAGELIAGKKEREALRAGTGAFLGFLLGGLAKFVLGCVMIGIFVRQTLF